MIYQADAAMIPFADKTFHAVVTSPPYWGLRKYAGEQGKGKFPNLGSEPTPDEHINRMVEIFREVKRVLRDDGVAWVNYMDSHHAGNLCLIPQRLIIALQEDSWYVRQIPIWWKTNPMPESPAGWRWTRHRIKNKERKPANWDERPAGWQDGLGDGETISTWDDCPGCEKCLHDNPTFPQLHILKRGSWRHTTAHEYIFMLTKQMQYWSNQEAIREIYTGPPNRWGGDTLKEETVRHSKYLDMMKISPTSALRAGRNMRPGVGRNPRSVLDVPTKSYQGAHYATFPPALIAPFIKATCPRRACPECGQGWSPIVEKGDYERPDTEHFDLVNFGDGANRSKHAPPINISVTGYAPTCSCGRDDHVPGIVLDPFVGSGTTGEVAKSLLRRWAGLDISMEYLDEQAKTRALNWTPSKALEGLPLFDGLNK